MQYINFFIIAAILFKTQGSPGELKEPWKYSLKQIFALVISIENRKFKERA